jgi:hypothetical protein
MEFFDEELFDEMRRGRRRKMAYFDLSSDDAMAAAAGVPTAGRTTGTRRGPRSPRRTSMTPPSGATRPGPMRGWRISSSEPNSD